VSASDVIARLRETHKRWVNFDLSMLNEEAEIARSLPALLECAEALAMADELIHELADERTPAHVEMTPAEKALVAFRRHTRAALQALAVGGGE